MALHVDVPEVIDLALAAAQVQLRERQAEEALASVERALPLLEQLGDRVREGAAFELLSDVLYRLGEEDRAAEAMERAVELARQQKDAQAQMVRLGSLGILYGGQDKHELAIARFEEALDLCNEKGTAPDQAFLLRHLGCSYLEMEQPGAGLLFLWRAFSCSSEAHDLRGLCEGLAPLARAFIRLGAPKEAMRLFRTTIPVMRKRGLHRLAAQALYELAEVHLEDKDYKGALRALRQALPAARKDGPSRLLADVLADTGLCRARLGQHEEALRFHEEALGLARQLGLRELECQELLELGARCKKLKRLQEAAARLDEALPLLRELDRRGKEIMTLAKLGEVLVDLAQDERALESLARAAALMRAEDDSDIIGIVTYTLGLVTDRLSLDATAAPRLRPWLQVLEQALKVVRERDDGREAYLLSCLGSVCATLGLSRKALGYYRQALGSPGGEGKQPVDPHMLVRMGNVYCDLRDPQRATKCYEWALRISRDCGERHAEAVALHNLAVIHAEAGRTPLAIATMEQALLVYEELELPGEERVRETLERWRSDEPPA